MINILGITVRGMLRDRVAYGICGVGFLFLLVPTISSLSMRQMTEISVTLSLSLISFILLLIAVFLGGTALWKDMERKYTISVLSLPVSRGAYVLGRFLGYAVFMLAATVILGVLSVAVINIASTLYPPGRPISWDSVVVAILFLSLKYVLLLAIAFLFSSLSTSFFLPIFGSISIYFVGSSLQQAHDFIATPAAANIPLVIRKAADVLYYVLPNFSAFDFRVNAMYAIPLPLHGLLLTSAYFLIYITIVMALAVIIFNRREVK